MSEPSFVNTFSDLQWQVAVWTARNFPNEDRQTVVLGLAEEVGEMCRAAVKQSQGIRGTHAQWDAEMRKEIGDAAIKLAHVAEIWGFDLREAISERWAEVSQRDFVTDPIGHGLPS
jgi:NTP pyrophosphatase (non-canonical NTP hydrolase)